MRHGVDGGQYSKSRPHSWSIRTRIAVLVALAMLSVTAALSWLMYSTALQWFKEDLTVDLMRHNQSIAFDIDVTVDKVTGTLLMARHNPAFNQFFLADNEQQRSAARAIIEDELLYVQTLYAITEACIIDDIGIDQVRCVGGVVTYADDLSVSEADDPFFSPTMALGNGEIYRSSEPFMSQDTNQWVIALTTPIILPGGRPAGMVHFEIPLTWFIQKVSGDELFRGYSFLMTLDGKALAHPDLVQLRAGAGAAAPNSGPEDFPSLAGWGPPDFQRVVSAMMLGGQGTATFHDKGEAYSLVYQPTFGGDWIIASVLPQSSILSLVAGVLGQALAIAVPLLLGGLGFTVWYASHLVSPLQQLKVAMRAIADDDVQHAEIAIPTRGEGEIGEIASAFDEMHRRLETRTAERNRADQELHVLNTELEHRVVERTRELASTNASLKESEGRFRRLAEYAPDMIYRFATSPALACEYLSPAVERITGYSLAEYEADPSLALSTVFPGDSASLSRQQTRDRVPEYNKGNQENRVVVQRMRKDGSVVWLEHQVVPVYDDRGLLYAIEGIARDITDRKKMEEQLERQALFDALTGLPNRTLLLDRLQMALRTAEREHNGFAFFMLDLDRFKEVNDTLGHSAGDTLLQQVAARLQLVVRGTDTVARLGGDEFAVVTQTRLGGDEFGIVTPGLINTKDPLMIARRIISALQKPFDIRGSAVGVSVSIGVAYYPDHGTDGETLMQHADVAMYVAKKTQSGYAVYSRDRDLNDIGRLGLLTELRQAIVADQLVLHYQPQLDLATGQVQWVEALVRWQHSGRGLVMPGDFIPLAEQTGLIHEVTLWVLNSAMRQLHLWEEAGMGIGIAVNLSARDLHDTELLELVAGRIAAWQVPPGRLKLEITESAMMIDPDWAMQTIQKLRDSGIHISIDDFGTGYSSLSYLNRIPLSEIKIDQSFVMDQLSNEQSAMIVQATINLAHRMGFITVAEGVETQAVCDQLKEWRCDLVQGYLISRPLPAEELERWLKNREGQS